VACGTSMNGRCSYLLWNSTSDYGNLNRAAVTVARPVRPGRCSSQTPRLGIRATPGHECVTVTESTQLEALPLSSAESPNHDSMIAGRGSRARPGPGPGPWLAAAGSPPPEARAWAPSQPEPANPGLAGPGPPRLGPIQ
jgi:hypothetical protein